MAVPGFRFTSDAAGDVFTVVGFEGSEAISQLYRYEIELKSPETETLDYDAILRAGAHLRMDYDGAEYPLHGVLASLDELQTAGGYTYYKAVLVPRLWQLSLYRTNEIFTAERTLDAILTTVLEAAGWAAGTDFDLGGLVGTFLDRDYVCQFRESDSHFVSRLMENEGVFYYFEQGADQEKLVIRNDAAYPAGGLPDVTFDAAPSGASTYRSIRSWLCRRDRLPASVSVRDYNPEQPSLDVFGTTDVDVDGVGTEYLYGENFKDESEARHLSDIRAEAFTCRKTLHMGESGVCAFRHGTTFSLAGHPKGDYNGTHYLITEITHKAENLDAGTQSGNGPEARYENTFVAIEASVQFRPQRTTPKPRFYGTMTAFVYAEAATDMAEVDEQGRYRVHLPFDRADGGKTSADPNRKASAWIRMAQPYVGEEEGMYFPLRGGTEVLLTFINGDPDRPIICGAVPNASTPSLLTAEHSTESIIRSKSNNKIRMEDAVGEERIVIDSPHSNSWIRVGARNDPITLNGPSPMYVEQNEAWGDPKAVAVAPDGTVTELSAVNASDIDISNVGDYTVRYEHGSDTATRVVRVYSTAANIVDTVADADGVRVRSAGVLWLEAQARHGLYVVGTPAVDALPRKVTSITDAPSELGDLIDNFGTNYNPTGLRNYKTNGEVTFSGETAGSTLAAFKQAEVRVSSLDTFITQEGNIYDFGGYWNYNLGNCYVENHIDQKAALNASGHTMDLLDAGGPGWGALVWPSASGKVSTSDTQLDGDFANGNVWVEKKFGNSYDYLDGDAVSVSKGSTVDVAYGGRHVEVKYNGSGALVAWSKSEAGESWEKRWTGTGTKTYESYEHAANQVMQESKWFRDSGALNEFNTHDNYGNTTNSMSFSWSNSSSASFSFSSLAAFEFEASASFTLAISLTAAMKIDIKPLELNINVPWTGIGINTTKGGDTTLDLPGVNIKLEGPSPDIVVKGPSAKIGVWGSRAELKSDVAEIEASSGLNIKGKVLNLFL